MPGGPERRRRSERADRVLLPGQFRLRGLGSPGITGPDGCLPSRPQGNPLHEGGRGMCLVRHRVPARCPDDRFGQGVLMMAAGICDIVLAAGAEKMTSSETTTVTEALASAGDAESEMRLGLTFPGTFGIIMRRHMYQYGTTREQVAMVSVKNRRNGSANPKAHFQKAVTLDEVLESRLLCHPLRLYDCPPISDGASAAVLCASEIAGGFTDRPIDVIGSGHAMGPGTLFEMTDLTTFEATVIASREAYRAAGVSPSDIDVAEVHDCFSIAEIAATEDLGFVEKGKGG